MVKAKASATRKKSTKPAGPTQMELWLHAPQMDALLRAGIGGLAAVLKQLESQGRSGDNQWLPGGPWTDDEPPWEVSNDRIRLHFGDPEDAGEYLKRLFEHAFLIDDSDSVIDLPVTYRSTQDAIVKAWLQRGLMLTFLQHGQSRKVSKKDIEKRLPINGKEVSYSLRPLTSYKHQTGYKELVDKHGVLRNKATELPGTLYPGAAVRHNKFSSRTKHEGTPAELLAAYFALIGTISLPINRGSAVLLIPEVSDLENFARYRADITPRSYDDCLIGGIGDAVLGAYARLTAHSMRRTLNIPAVTGYLFRPTVWASQQKSRVAGTRIEPLDPAFEKIFDYANDFFRPQLKSHNVKTKAPRGNIKTTTEVEQSFWSTSMIKPLIADNLANRKPWFEGFANFFTRKDPANGKPLYPRLFFEKKGLANMVDSEVWSHAGQEALVRGVQFALSCRFGEISGQFSGNPQGMKNKFQKEFEKWRIQFVSSKTADQFRFAVCDLMSRGRGNKEIQENWQSVLPLLSDASWQHGRDLALLALASYRGKGDKEITDIAAEPDTGNS